MKQQEHQKALNYFIRKAKKYDKDLPHEDESFNVHSDRLQQLIDKLPYWLELEERDKPIKPTHIENNRYSCGNCFMSFTIPKVRFVNNQFCGVCGKKLDWSDEE